MRGRSLARVQRLFVLVLLSAQLVFHLEVTWSPAAVTWLRRLGGRLDLGIDRNGPLILLAGLGAVGQAVTTLFLSCYRTFLWVITHGSSSGGASLCVAVPDVRRVRRRWLGSP